MNKCLLNPSFSKEGIAACDFVRRGKLRLLAKCIRRYDRRRNRTLAIEQQHRNYFGGLPRAGTRPWRFYDEWAGKRVSLSHDDALHQEEEALLLLQRLCGLVPCPERRVVCRYTAQLGRYL